MFYFACIRLYACDAKKPESPNQSLNTARTACRHGRARILCSGRGHPSRPRLVFVTLHNRLAPRVQTPFSRNSHFRGTECSQVRPNRDVDTRSMPSNSLNVHSVSKPYRASRPPRWCFLLLSNCPVLRTLL